MELTDCAIATADEGFGVGHTRWGIHLHVYHRSASDGHLPAVNADKLLLVQKHTDKRCLAVGGARRAARGNSRSAFVMPSIRGTSFHNSLTVPADVPLNNEVIMPHALVNMSAPTISPKTIYLCFMCLAPLA